MKLNVLSLMQHLIINDRISVLIHEIFYLLGLNSSIEKSIAINANHCAARKICSPDPRYCAGERMLHEMKHLLKSCGGKSGSFGNIFHLIIPVQPSNADFLGAFCIFKL